MPFCDTVPERISNFGILEKNDKKYQDPKLETPN